MGADTRLDTCGLKCPLPVMKAAKFISTLAPGEKVEIFATDPGAVEDFKVFCDVKGHDLLETGEEGGRYRFLIKKKEQPI